MRGLLPFINIPYADDITQISLILQVFAFLVLLSVAVAVTRRLIFPPAHLQKTRDAWIILSLISILMITLILGQGFKGVYELSEMNISAYILSPLFKGMTKSAADALMISMWWIHMATVLFFLAYIPYSKAYTTCSFLLSMCSSAISTGAALSTSGGAMPTIQPGPRNGCLI